MRRTLIIASVLTICTIPLLAQPQPDPVAVVAHVLELSEAQMVAWGDILHTRQEAVEPLAHRAQAVQQQIAETLGSSSPDPATLGLALIELKALQTQIGAANAQSAEQFEHLLTPDQMERLGAIRGGAQVCPIVPAFQATGLLGGS